MPKDVRRSFIGMAVIGGRANYQECLSVAICVGVGANEIIWPDDRALSSAYANDMGSSSVN